MENENNERNDAFPAAEEENDLLSAPAEELLPGETDEEQLPAEAEAAETEPSPEPQPVPQAKESRRERKAREKEEARQEKERAKQKAKEEKAAARAAKRAEIKYRNIPTVIILSLILALFVAGLGFVGWQYIGARSMIDSITAEKAGLVAEIDDLSKSLEEKETQIRDQLAQIEDKNAQLSDGDAATKELSERIADLEGQIQSMGEEAGEVLDVISCRDPLGVAYSGNFYADRAVVVIGDGESFPLSIYAMYDQKKTDISYSFDDSTRNIDTVSPSSDETITGSSGLFSVTVKKKNADETGLAVLKFENEHSSDFFYVIIIVK